MSKALHFNKGKICSNGCFNLCEVTEGNTADEALDAFYAEGINIESSKCKPLYPYAVFAEDVLGIDKAVAPNFSKGLSPGGHSMLWMEANVSFNGNRICPTFYFKKLKFTALLSFYNI